MGLFSEELLELDRNTVMLMIEERKKELENLKLEHQKLIQVNRNLKLENQELKKLNKNLELEHQKRMEELEKNTTENTSTPNIP
nr:hypothetical protein [uncultured Mediterraneibacter sp.]